VGWEWMGVCLYVTNAHTHTHTHSLSPSPLVELPCRMWPRLRFQIWDYDFFSPDDSICTLLLLLLYVVGCVTGTGLYVCKQSCQFLFVFIVYIYTHTHTHSHPSIPGEMTMSLKGLCKRALKTKRRVVMTKNGKDKMTFTGLTSVAEEGKAQEDCMGLYGIVWDCMGLYGIVWDCMGLYGIVWDCMGLYGVCMGLYGIVWDCMGLYGIVWDGDGDGDCEGDGSSHTPTNTQHNTPNNTQTRNITNNNNNNNNELHTHTSPAPKPAQPCAFQKKGDLILSIELIPSVETKKRPAGKGRSDPNMNPFLPPPEGRVNWSLFHPLNLLYEILGPGM